MWSEELVTNSGYISDVRTSNTLIKPFTGLQAGSVGDATYHGYGMSAFVKYIVKKYGNNVLVNIYNKIFAGRHVVDAINNSINHNIFMDYNPFLQQYAQGQLYSDIGHDILANNRDDTFKIASETDTLKTFTANYKDLSAKLYLVTLDYQNFKDDASLEISIDQDLCDITVFQYPKTGGTVSVLAKGQKNCIVSDLKGLQQDKRLIVMVTNSNYISNNYTPSNKDIIVTMKVKNTKIARVEVDVFIDNANYNTSDGVVTGGEFNGDFTSIAGTSSLENGAYSTKFDNPPVLGQTIRGNMKVTFWLNISGLSRVNFEVNQTKTWDNFTGNHKQWFQINITSVPYNKSYTDDYTGLKVDEYYESGSSVNRIVANFKETWTVGNVVKIDELTTFNCGNRAFIKVKVHYK